MSIAARLRAVPWDAWTAYASILIYAASLFLTVLYLLDGMATFALIALPMLMVSIVALSLRSFFSATSRHRTFAMCLISVCALSYCGGSVRACMRLYLDRKVAMAGGEEILREWAEGIMNECQPDEPDQRLENDEIPVGVRTHLRGYVTANAEAVTIHLGGGFFHYWVNFRRYSGHPEHPATMSCAFE
jgi:hypothetical protein